MKMQRSCLISCIFVVLLFSASPVAAYCSEPFTPSRPSLDKPRLPDKPDCYDEYSNTHSCDEWEIESYNTEVDRFNRKLRQYQTDAEYYVRSLNRYVEEVVAYAKCEASALELQ